MFLILVGYVDYTTAETLWLKGQFLNWINKLAEQDAQKSYSSYFCTSLEGVHLPT